MRFRMTPEEIQKFVERYEIERRLCLRAGQEGGPPFDQAADADCRGRALAGIDSIVERDRVALQSIAGVEIIIVLFPPENRWD